MRLPGPHGGLGGKGAREFGENAPALDQRVLGHAADRDAIAVAEDEVVVELVLEDFGHVVAKHEAGEALENAAMFGFAEAAPDDADRVRGIPADAYAGPPLVESALDVHRAAPASWPVVEVPAEFARIHAGLQLAGGELQGGCGALLPCPLEVKFKQGVAREFPEDEGGMQRREAFAAREGALPIRDEEGASPVANLRFGANCGP